MDDPKEQQQHVQRMQDLRQNQAGNEDNQQREHGDPAPPRPPGDPPEPHEALERSLEQPEVISRSPQAPTHQPISSDLEPDPQYPLRMSADPPGSPQGLRRSGRTRRAPLRYKFDKQHGYALIKAYVGIILKDLRPQPTNHYNHRYLMALVLDPDTGLYEGITPTTLTLYPNILKAAATPDPDTPNLQQAMMSEHAEKFREAMAKEIADLEKHKTWRLVKRSTLPKDTNVLPGTWAFKIKRLPDGTLRKFKARFCVRGDKQIEGIDYFEKYAPVVSWSTVRLVMSIALQRGWATKQIDFENAFVQATLKEDVYIRCPPMFEPDGDGGTEYVMKLDKSLYGLVQAPLAWYDHLQVGLLKLGFKPSKIDPGLYLRDDMILLSYVDDCLFFGPDSKKIEEVIKQLKEMKYSLTEEDDVYAFLGVQVKQDGDKIKLSQPGLINKVINLVGMNDCNAKDTPCQQMPLGTDANGKARQDKWNYASAVGMLMYLCSNAHPEIQYAVHQCARFTHCPRASHEEAIKRICRYLKGVGNNGLSFSKSNNLDLNLYVDADFAGLWKYEDEQDPVCVKSRTGYVITLGNSPVSWVSKLQTEIALSTTEAEYIAMSQAMRDLLPMRTMLGEIINTLKLGTNGSAQVKSKVFEDNNGAIKTAQTPKLSPRTKHIAVKYHFFKSHIGRDKGIELSKIDTDEQKADILTKGLAAPKFKELRKLLCGW